MGNGSLDMEPGDRVASDSDLLDELGSTSLARETYVLGAGDVLAVNVQGHSALNYSVRPEVEVAEDRTVVTVGPTGEIYMPLIGNLKARGKTCVELESVVRSGLAEYFKRFDVSISLVKVRSLNIWISGETRRAGPQILPGYATVSRAVFRAGIRSTGSVRRVELTRGKDKLVVDLYKMAVLGDTSLDISLHPEDLIHVPVLTKYVNISGQVVRPGRYEMVTLSGDTESFRVKDVLDLALGLLPTAAASKAFIERIGGDGRKIKIGVDLQGGASSRDADATLSSGDMLVVPSISAFQPIIRLIGEFKGTGVYQRVIGPDNIEVQNKSGIYFLKQGQTVFDVISATGGVTPQADLKRARIERTENGKTDIIPVDLERLLVKSDKSADVALVNGDTLVLPAMADKVHVFGEVSNPGSYAYSPNRRLIDYLGNARGPTTRAKLSEVRVVRGTNDIAHALKLNAQRAMIGKSMKGNPVLEPGDIVYVPSKLIGDWRDGLQLVFSALSLQSLLRGR